MSVATSEIDLKKFCASETGKYALDHPYVRNGYRYACDGKIAIRLTAAGEPDDVLPDSFNPPDIDKIIAENTGTVRKPWPSREPYETQNGECLVCDGSGKVNRKECDDCEGFGTHTCRECGHERDCVACDGDGQIGGTKCPNCEGKGYGDDIPHHRIINGAAISIRYGELVDGLPEVEYTTDAPKQGPNASVCFRFAGGGAGVVMPIVLSK